MVRDALRRRGRRASSSSVLVLASRAESEPLDGAREDALEPERADDIDGEPEHDGWSPIRPRRPLARHVGDRFHALQHLDTALRLACFAGLVAKAVDKALNVLSLSLLAFIGGLLLCEFLSAGPFEPLEIAGVIGQPRRIEMEDAIADFSQQIAIMTDQ